MSRENKLFSDTITSFLSREENTLLPQQSTIQTTSLKTLSFDNYAIPDEIFAHYPVIPENLFLYLDILWPENTSTEELLDHINKYQHDSLFPELIAQITEYVNSRNCPNQQRYTKNSYFSGNVTLVRPSSELKKLNLSLNNLQKNIKNNPVQKNTTINNVSKNSSHSNYGQNFKLFSFATALLLFLSNLRLTNAATKQENNDGALTTTSVIEHTPHYPQTSFLSELFSCVSDNSDSLNFILQILSDIHPTWSIDDYLKKAREIAEIEPELAQTIVDIGLEHYSNNLELRLLKAEIFTNNNEPEKAIAAYNLIELSAINLHRIFPNQIALLKKTGNYVEAIKIARNFLFTTIIGHVETTYETAANTYEILIEEIKQKKRLSKIDVEQLYDSTQLVEVLQYTLGKPNDTASILSLLLIEIVNHDPNRQATIDKLFLTSSPIKNLLSNNLKEVTQSIYNPIKNPNPLFIKSNLEIILENYPEKYSVFPLFPDIKNCIADILGFIKKGDYKGVINDLIHRISLHKDSVVPREILAIIHENINELDMAIGLYQQMIGIMQSTSLVTEFEKNKIAEYQSKIIALQILRDNNKSYPKSYDWVNTVNITQIFPTYQKLEAYLEQQPRMTKNFVPYRENKEVLIPGNRNSTPAFKEKFNTINRIFRLLKKNEQLSSLTQIKLADILLNLVAALAEDQKSLGPALAEILRLQGTEYYKLKLFSLAQNSFEKALLVCNAFDAAYEHTLYAHYATIMGELGKIGMLGSAKDFLRTTTQLARMLFFLKPELHFAKYNEALNSIISHKEPLTVNYGRHFNEFVTKTLNTTTNPEAIEKLLFKEISYANPENFREIIDLISFSFLGVPTIFFSIAEATQLICLLAIAAVVVKIICPSRCLNQNEPLLITHEMLPKEYKILSQTFSGNSWDLSLKRIKMSEIKKTTFLGIKFSQDTLRKCLMQALPQIQCDDTNSIFIPLPLTPLPENWFKLFEDHLQASDEYKQVLDTKQQQEHQQKIGRISGELIKIEQRLIQYQKKLNQLQESQSDFIAKKSAFESHLKELQKTYKKINYASEILAAITLCEEQLKTLDLHDISNTKVIITAILEKIEKIKQTTGENLLEKQNDIDDLDSSTNGLYTPLEKAEKNLSFQLTALRSLESSMEIKTRYFDKSTENNVINNQQKSKVTKKPPHKKSIHIFNDTMETETATPTAKKPSKFITNPDTVEELEIIKRKIKEKEAMEKKEEIYEPVFEPVTQEPEITINDDLQVIRYHTEEIRVLISGSKNDEHGTRLVFFHLIRLLEAISNPDIPTHLNDNERIFFKELRNGIYYNLPVLIIIKYQDKAILGRLLGEGFGFIYTLLNFIDKLLKLENTQGDFLALERNWLKPFVPVTSDSPAKELSADDCFNLIKDEIAIIQSSIKNPEKAIKHNPAGNAGCIFKITFGLAIIAQLSRNLFKLDHHIHYTSQRYSEEFLAQLEKFSGTAALKNSLPEFHKDIKKRQEYNRKDDGPECPTPLLNLMMSLGDNAKFCETIIKMMLPIDKILFLQEMRNNYCHKVLKILPSEFQKRSYYSLFSPVLMYYFAENIDNDICTAFIKNKPSKPSVASKPGYWQTPPNKKPLAGRHGKEEIEAVEPDTEQTPNPARNTMG